ncbi:T9SS type A sorting domain-containing protein [Flavobacterium sp. DG1-102-2]|uniref:T9SS type A sorting domain-containing protein n=1 Tax=Flavobacterium sp. DG1-102-2 TaxID=3081663 RepID=UPI0029495F57|nr:T9SS type A sorting domain-containing protein [Flavobacterium sp. DG1-102-2]MDV6169405.1 T9SS type A sorting domain-containing protein [Flavobacterium sp. DG1-102-2]
MAKKYFYIALLLTCLFSLGVSAQENKAYAAGKEPIEGLSIYPNPAKDRIYITTAKPAMSKDVEIFDMLGKRIMQATLNGKELSITNLNRGVYIIKIKEGDASATRKLVVE